MKYFGHKGAYSRLKDLLEQRGLLDKWHEYERLATKSALLKWAEENGIAVAVPGALTGAEPFRQPEFQEPAS